MSVFISASNGPPKDNVNEFDAYLQQQPAQVAVEFPIIIKERDLVRFLIMFGKSVSNVVQFIYIMCL